MGCSPFPVGCVCTDVCQPPVLGTVVGSRCVPMAGPWVWEWHTFRWFPRRGVRRWIATVEHQLAHVAACGLSGCFTGLHRFLARGVGPGWAAGFPFPVVGGTALRRFVPPRDHEAWLDILYDATLSCRYVLPREYAEFAKVGVGRLHPGLLTMILFIVGRRIRAPACHGDSVHCWASFIARVC